MQMVVKTTTTPVDGTATTTTETLNFSYDASGVPLAVDYNGTDYYYVANIQGDIMAILNTSGEPVVEYTYDAWGKLYSTTGTLADTLGEANPLTYRGYVYDQDSNLYYLQSRYYDPEVGRFINADSIMGADPNITTYNLFVYCGNNPVVRCDCSGSFWVECILVSIRFLNDVLICIGIDTAAIGAFFLEMSADSSGIYHADFDCWQQEFGYNIAYDIAFDAATSMETARFSFIYNGEGFTIWAWKGDYLNLGAGAELGIYRGNSGHRTVDKSLAMKMSMCVVYNQTVIIDYAPVQFQWWITGFNPNYQHISAKKLTACFMIRFHNTGMYQAFKSAWGGDSRWTFFDGGSTAVFVF